MKRLRGEKLDKIINLTVSIVFGISLSFSIVMFFLFKRFVQHPNIEIFTPESILIFIVAAVPFSILVRKYVLYDDHDLKDRSG